MTSEPAPPGGVHHVAIQVVDLGATETFYRSVLGLAVLRRWPAQAADTVGAAGAAAGDRSVWLDLGAGAFLALERVTPGVARRDDEGPGLHLLALQIPRSARADWEAKLRAAGVDVVHRTAYTLYVRDPEGNRIGLSHWPEAQEG